MVLNARLEDDGEAGGLGVPVVTMPELVKAWADAAKADDAAVAKLLRDIQVYAHFAPHKTMPLYAWWQDILNPP